MADDWKRRFKKYVEDNKQKDSALSSTEEDNLQDEDDLRDYRDQQAQDNGGYPEE
tara:strand:- start:251 stop:415 length:165 start_codon:yes stop_codon:yes gene_type:complete